MGLWKLIKPLTSDNTNLITNPSLETAITGYVAKGTNTVAQSTDYQFRGLYSLKCTYQDTLNLWGYTAAGLSTSTTYYLKGRVYVPFNWDGGDISLNVESFSGATATVVSKYTDGTSPKGAWILLETTLVLASDAAGGYLLVTSSAPTAGRFVYFDCLYISTQDADYFDGDEPGAEWTGTVHASTSKMSAKSRRGGAVVNLDDYSTFVESHAGTGMPAVSNRTRQLALQHGAEYLGYDVLPRLVTLVRTTIGTTLADLHTQRKALIDALKGDLVAGAQPIKLRYTGAHGANEAEINVVYDAGLEFGGSRGFSERGAVRLLAYDPFWYSLNDEAIDLSTQAPTERKTNVNYVLSRQAGEWSNMDQGVGAFINTLAVGPDRTLYLGGNFTTVGSGAASANYIASWNGTSYSALGSGLNGQAIAIRVDSNGDLYVGGAFTTAGGSGANYIAKWNGSAWSALGTGLNGNVNDILISKDGSIYVCGNFTTAGGAGANYIAKWSGSAWSALGTGLGATANALTEDASGNIYVTGQFTTAGGSSANYVAKWDGTSWSALGSGLGATGNDILFSSDGLLYVVGTFTTADGNTANRVALWNGATWATLGTGFNNQCTTIEELDGVLYFGGVFTSAGVIQTTDGVALWNGSSFVNIDIDFPSSPSGFAFAFDDYGVDPIVYFGFTMSGTMQLGGTTTLTNSGTAETYPVIVVQNSAARGNNAKVLFLRNETTGDTLWLNYTIVNEDVLYIDLSPGYKRVESALLGNVIGSAILPGSDLSTFRLASGQNVISLFVSEAGTPSLKAYMKWRPRHWSLDGVAA